MKKVLILAAAAGALSLAACTASTVTPGDDSGYSSSVDSGSLMSDSGMMNDSGSLSDSGSMMSDQSGAVVNMTGSVMMNLGSSASSL